jgi:hypothetical protein
MFKRAFFLFGLDETLFPLFDVLLAPLIPLNGPLGDLRPFLLGFTDPPDTVPLFISIAEFRLFGDLLRTIGLFPKVESLDLKFFILVLYAVRSNAFFVLFINAFNLFFDGIDKV